MKLRVFLVGLTLGFACGPSAAMLPVTEDETGSSTSDEDRSTSTTSQTPPPPDEPDNPGTDDGATTSTTGSAADDEAGTSSSGPSGDGPTSGGCGDGRIGGSERCDCGGMPCTPAGLDGVVSCIGVTNFSMPDVVYTGGTLDCNPASCQYRFDGCTFCGDHILDAATEACELDEPLQPAESCEDLGLGPGTEPLPCTADCQIDTTCCLDPAAPECTSG